MTGTLGLLSVTWRTLALGFQCVDFCVNTSFGTPGVTKASTWWISQINLQLVKKNQIPVPEDKLKEEQKKEYKEVVKEIQT